MKETQIKFVGLRPYKQSDSENFIGREKSVEDALEILKKNKILTINGSEGSGKTSFINAGILKRIESNFLGNSGRKWNICKLRPGVSPIENLCSSLSTSNQLYLDSKPKASDYEDYLQIIEKKNSFGLLEIYKKSEIFDKRNLLIVIDQVEDLFKYSKIFDNEISSEDDLLIDLIYKSVKNESCSIYFILAIESNYFSKLNIYGKFSELLSLSQYNLANINLKNFLSVAKNNINFNMTESVFEKIQIQISENPSYLTNFQYLLKKYSDSKDFNGAQLDDKAFKKNGGLKKIINQSFEEYFNNQNENDQRKIELIFRSMIQADLVNINNFYQEFKYIKNYCEVEDNELINLFQKLNTEFGEIFDIVTKNISEIKSQNKFKINDGDIIILKYSKCMSWNRFNLFIKEEILLFNEFEKYQNRIEDNKEISQKDLIHGIELINNKNVNEKWSEKYEFNFTLIKDYLINKKNEFEIKKEISIAKELKKKRGLKIKLILGIITFFVVLVGGIERHHKITVIEKKVNKLENQELKIQILEHEKDSMIKKSKFLALQIESDLESLESKENIIESKQNMLYKRDQKIADDGQKISEQQINLNRKIYEIDSAKKELSINQKFITLTKKEIKLNNDINELAKETILLKRNDKDKILNFANKSLILYSKFLNLKRLKDSLIKVHQNDLKSTKELTLASQTNHENSLRKLTYNIISKINGVNNIIEVEDLNLLKGLNKSKKNRLNIVSISKDNRIFCAGESGEIFYSNEINKDLENLTFSAFKLGSEITALKPINSDVVIAGLKNGEIWYLSISENIKTKIFPEKKREEISEVKSLEYQNGKIYTVYKKMLIEYNLKTKVLSEILIGPIDDLVQLTYNKKNKLYVLTKKGNIIQYDIIKKTNTLLFESSNKVLSHNDMVTKIESFSDKFVFSTLNGWIYIFDDDNGYLKYDQRILAHNSEIISLFFDEKFDRIFSSSSQGTFCILDLNKDSNSLLSRTDINFGIKSTISDVNSFTIKDKSFIITTSSIGTLTFSGLKLNQAFNYIKKKINS